MYSIYIVNNCNYYLRFYDKSSFEFKKKKTTETVSNKQRVKVTFIKTYISLIDP